MQGKIFLFNVEALIFFRLLPSNCLNWKIYCDDHSSLSSTTAVQYEFHIYFTDIYMYIFMYFIYIYFTNFKTVMHITYLFRSFSPQNSISCLHTRIILGFRRGKIGRKFGVFISCFDKNFRNFFYNFLTSFPSAEENLVFYLRMSSFSRTLIPSWKKTKHI